MSNEITAAPNWPPEMAAFFQQTYVEGLVFYHDAFHAYHRGAWHLVEDVLIRRQIAGFFGADAKPGKMRKLVELMRDFLGVDSRMVSPSPSKICLLNGTLDTDAYRLEAHSREHLLQTRTPINWEPKAKCPRWHKFLNEVFANDQDRPQKVAFVQQWFGYCLVPDNAFHKFLWLVGGGGNGKSVLLTVIEKLVGDDNVSHLHLDQLRNKFARAELKGKLLNISPEIEVGARIADGYMKALVSGDVVQAERKFKDPFKFRPYVRLMAATNNLPRLDDVSEGFFRRAILLEFNRQFSQAEQNPRLIDELLKEMPGILIWAVQGLQDLRKKGGFTIPPSSENALRRFREEADVERMFVRERTKAVQAGGVGSQVIYGAYVDFCRSSGFSPKHIVGLGRRLAELKVPSRMSNGKKYYLVQISA